MKFDKMCINGHVKQCEPWLYSTIWLVVFPQKNGWEVANQITLH